jgi:hypothetical protein
MTPDSARRGQRLPDEGGDGDRLRDEDGDGLDLHPAAVAFSVSAATDSGRCPANMTSATSTGTSAQNVSRKCSRPMPR